MDRRRILQGCRDGFAACYDLFMGEAAAVAEAADGESDGEDIRQDTFLAGECSETQSSTSTAILLLCF